MPISICLRLFLNIDTVIANMSITESSSKMRESIGIETSGLPPKHAVTQAYQELLTDQASQPDKIFVTGHELRHLDPNFVSLDEDTQEHPRVSVSNFTPVSKLTFVLVLANRQESARHRSRGRLLFHLALRKHHIRSVHPPSHERPGYHGQYRRRLASLHLPLRIGDRSTLSCPTQRTIRQSSDYPLWQFGLCCLLTRRWLLSDRCSVLRVPVLRWTRRVCCHRGSGWIRI